MRVCAVIPALDEEASVGGVVRDVLRTGLVERVVVGDNGSSDATAAIAAEAGADVVVVPERGYGAACAGAVERLGDACDVIVFLDADGSDDPAEIARLLEPIEQGRADLVIGSRALGEVEPGALTPQQRFGNRLATFMIRVLWGHRYTDLGPFRAIRKGTYDAIGMEDRRYGWTVEMQIRALQIDARVIEVPVSYRKRIGRSKISGTVRGVLLAGYWIVTTILRLRFFRDRAQSGGDDA